LLIELAVPELFNDTNTTVGNMGESNYTWPNTSEARKFLEEQIKPDFYTNHIVQWLETLPYMGGSCDECERRRQPSQLRSRNLMAGRFGTADQFAMTIAVEFQKIKSLKRAHPDIAEDVMRELYGPEGRLEESKQLYSDEHLENITHMFGLYPRPPNPRFRELVETLKRPPKIIYPTYYNNYANAQWMFKYRADHIASAPVRTFGQNSHPPNAMYHQQLYTRMKAMKQMWDFAGQSSARRK
jgi:hypothetical protein